MVQDLAVEQTFGPRCFRFSWRMTQFKEMASRLTGGCLAKYCMPRCGTPAKNELQDDKSAVYSTAGDMHSPQFSLKSYQMNGHTPTRQDQLAYLENQQASPQALRSLHKNFADAAARNGESKERIDHEGSGYRFNNEWVALVETGVYITFCTAPDGFNDLKQIKFSRALFRKQDAENWWTENCPRIRALYNVRPPSSTTTEDDRFSSGYATPDAYSKSPSSTYTGGDYLRMRRKPSADARLREDYKSNDPQTGESTPNSWIEQDDVGVYITIIMIPGVGKQLKRVQFSQKDSQLEWVFTACSQEKFSKMEAAAWWEHNRQRIYAQYIFTNTRLQGK